MKLEPIPDIVKKNFDDDSIVYNTDTHMYYGNETNQNIISDIRNNAMQIYGGYYIFEKGKGWNSPKIYLTGRGESSGKFKIKLQNFKPYCYEYDENGDYKTYLDEPCRKIIFTGVHPWFVKRYREQRRRKKGRIPYEADILFVRRFLCDMYDYFKPTKAIQPEVAIIDIETNFPVNDDIIAFSLNNMKDYLYYESKFETSNPYVLALSLFDQLKPYDWVTGWNVKFDIKITMNHLEKIQDIWNFINSSNNLITIDDLVNRQINSFTRIQLEEIVNELVRQGYLIKHEDIIITDKDFDYDISHMLAIVDLLVISKKMHAREIRGKWSLDNVGMKLCGIGKRHIGATKIKDLKQDELFEYNCLDVIIPEIIDATLGGLEGHNILSWSLQSIVEDTLITAVVNDIALIRAYHKQKIVLPSRDYSKQKAKGETYDAADPDARHGFYKGIIATDLVHAYPWAVLSKNTSCESKCDDGVNIVQFINKNGEERIIRFNNNKSTFIKTLQEIMDERGKIKKKLNTLTKGSNDWQTYKSIDFALKTQAAAFSHGIFGWENSRMYDLDVADAITAIVRELIVKIKDACDLIGRRWVYAHTDSCFVNAPKDEANKVLEYLNKVIFDHCKGYRTKPNLDYQDYYNMAYIHTAARKVMIPEDGNIDDVDSWEVTGMNMMRSETPEPLAEIEINILKSKFKDKTNSVILDEVREEIRDLRLKDSTELATIKPLTKPLHEYGKTLLDGSHGNIPYHIKSLMRASDEYGFTVNVGEKFGILPIITDEYTGKRIKKRKRVFIAFDTETGLPDNYIIDYTSYLKSNLWGKICKILDMTSKELEKEVMTEHVKSALFVGVL